MVLNVHSDASYLTAPKARSRAGGHFFLGSLPRKGCPIKLNGAILTLCTILKCVAVSAAEPPRSLLPRSASLEQDDVSWLHEPSEAALHAGRRRDALSLFAHGTLTIAALGVALLSTALLPVALLTKLHLLSTLLLTTRLTTAMTGTASSTTDGGRRRSRARTPRRYASRSVRVRARACVGVGVRVRVRIRIRIRARA